MVIKASWILTIAWACLFLFIDVITAAPPEPGADDYDWVQFNNGEWLKGEIKELHNDDFTFDSDELDMLNIDWADVHAVYSPNHNTCVLEDKSVIQGTLEIVEDQVTVITDAEEKTFPRSALQSVIPGGLSEWDFWSMKLSLGLTAREGNTDQSDLSSMFNIERLTPGFRMSFDYNGAYSNVNSEETVNNHHAIFRYSIYLTRRLSLVLPSLDYYQDKLQNISSRFTPGTGLGYDLIDRSAVEWSVGAGGGYQQTRYFSVEAPQDKSEETSVVIAGTDLNWDITKDLEFTFNYHFNTGLKSGSSTDHHILSVFSFSIWKDLDLDVSLGWDHVGSPKTREDGTVPDRNDLRTTVGIGWEF
jgi:putative salt-induced outer membrane protein YdiY